ncbi:MAG: Dihydroneopterin triphosphate pyrophosphatase [Pseudomonadota bacterium]|jgi:dATP pyrophosphohydrolase
MPQSRSFKIPQSVLVLIHTPDLEVLLIQRADAMTWQSVTGSLDQLSEPFAAAAVREVMEETGIDALAPGHRLIDWQLQNIYDIYPHYLHRYAPGVSRNTERVFGLTIPGRLPIRLSPEEHVAHQWLNWLEAADVVSSGSNAEAILQLPQRLNEVP